ncbi:cathepsin W-like [Platysternon megacephalum]|uniref:Cathepsin W-like n=1 Tax=Platysternon megacephalum TaxID=55544 RepID=A0A4D9ETC4_9SAUR|nr:cathepsin W-like [Platysternon megacephalum]
MATWTGQADVMEHLINTGVDVNSQKREGHSTLHDARQLNHYKIIKILMLRRTDMMAQNLTGKTPHRSGAAMPGRHLAGTGDTGAW